MPLENLYREIILDHFKSPRNFGKLEHPAVVAHHENPLCGDKIELQIAIDEGFKISEIKFYGHGCAISQASASMMTVAVKEKSIDEVRKLMSRFKSLFSDEAPASDVVEWGELKALEGVKKFPTRVECATLAWIALEKCLKH